MQFVVGNGCGPQAVPLPEPDPVWLPPPPPPPWLAEAPPPNAKPVEPETVATLAVVRPLVPIPSVVPTAPTEALPAPEKPTPKPPLCEPPPALDEADEDDDALPPFVPLTAAAVPATPSATAVVAKSVNRRMLYLRAREIQGARSPSAHYGRRFHPYSEYRRRELASVFDAIRSPDPTTRTARWVWDAPHHRRGRKALEARRLCEQTAYRVRSQAAV